MKKKWWPVPRMPVISAMAMMTYSHLSITSRSTPVVLTNTKANNAPMISSHVPSTHRWTTNHQYILSRTRLWGLTKLNRNINAKPHRPMSKTSEMLVLRPLSTVMLMLNKKPSATITMPSLVGKGCSRNSRPMVISKSLPVSSASLAYGTVR